MTNNEINNFNNFDDMTEEEFMKLFAAKKTNSQKSIAAVYAFVILNERTDPDHPFTQVQIGEILERDYEVIMDRQAIGRTLHTLEDGGLNICHNNKGWYAA